MPCAGVAEPPLAGVLDAGVFEFEEDELPLFSQESVLPYWLISAAVAVRFKRHGLVASFTFAFPGQFVEETHQAFS